MSEFLKLKKSDCKNCYKCIRNCPVKSIRFSAGQANIVPEECVLCGRCVVVCPQNAKKIVSEVEKARVLVMSGAPVVASVAPSFAAYWDGAGIASVERALKKLGFYAAEETALGATQVKRAYEDLLRDHTRDVVISSSCHAVNLLIQKHFPDVLPYLADVASPMQAHCADVKRRVPGAKVVFVGPCLAKKDEADRYPGFADAVLTFEEADAWLAEEGVELERAPSPSDGRGRARLFPTAGGILKTMDCNEKGYAYLSVDGPEACIEALRDIASGRVRDCFIEMSMCENSCVGGPVMARRRGAFLSGALHVQEGAGPKDFDVAPAPLGSLCLARTNLAPDPVEPGEEQIREILARMGKTRPQDELNCGTCGYNTCREKARAVFLGKADLTMCLPFLKEKAEKFSLNILENSPNGILVLNDALEVQQLNRAAMDIMNVRAAPDVLGEPLVRILDPGDFLRAQAGAVVRDEKRYLAEYRRWIVMTIVPDREFKTLLCIMRDVTAEETQREEKERVSRRTAETADRVVEKQMRIVQEIASLLGETAAETKIALTRLKESIGDE